MVPPVPMPATKASNLPAGLLPDLRRGGQVVGLDVVGVVVLVHVEAVGRLGGDALGHRVVALRRVGRDVGRGHHHLGAEGLERVLLLLRHLVRHGEDAAVPLHGGRDGQRHPGVAAGVLHDGAALAEQPGLLGLLEDVDRHAVLDGAARIHVLELDEHGGGARPARPCRASRAACGRWRTGRRRGRTCGAYRTRARRGVNAPGRAGRRGGAGGDGKRAGGGGEGPRGGLPDAGAGRLGVAGAPARRARLDAELLAGGNPPGLPGGDGDAARTPGPRRSRAAAPRPRTRS